MTPRLTIVLPLKGRDEFTFRFLWHANQTKLPYRFLIADGQVNETVARQLENSREAFPELDIEYIRYPTDDSYSRFFAKMSDALQRVRTPYAMLADNDDFLGPNAIDGALDYLDLHSDYVCARGRMVAFSVFSGFGHAGGPVRGDLNDIFLQYDSNDASESSAAERLRHGLDLGRYYAVYRTKALATIWEDATKIDFSDLMLHESFHALRAATLGKVHVDKTSICYFRQIGTSSNYDPSRSWVHHLLRSRFTWDMQAMAGCLSTAAADCAEAGAIAENVRAIIEQYVREFLFVNFGAVAQLKRTVRVNFPALVRYVQSRPRLFVERKRSAVLSRLAAEGASAKSLERSRTEFADIESSLSQVPLDSGFAGRFAPTRKSIRTEMVKRPL